MSSTSLSLRRKKETFKAFDDRNALTLLINVGISRKERKVTDSVLGEL